jgi:hypothetical protein
VNSEELERSLRTEFETYLKNIAADLKREAAEFQGRMETEFARHKSQLDQLVNEFSDRVSVERTLDSNFRDAVVEHLRLARDEGARITATAFAEAEQLAESTAGRADAGAVNVIRKAIFDISTKNTQSAILKSLVQHAAAFTPRGVFFIVKNDQLVGWKSFGSDPLPAEDLVREVSFAINQKTMPGTAVNLLSSVDSNFDSSEGDTVYLDKLGLGRPDKMYAIPLLVRGRAVAVVYADHGVNGSNVDIDALETIVRVAGLTVEILAAGRVEKSSQPASDITAEEDAPAYEAPTAPVISSFNVTPAVQFEQAAPVNTFSGQIPSTSPEVVASPAEFSFEPAPTVETVPPSMGSLGVSYNEPAPFQQSANWGESAAMPQNTFVPEQSAPPAPTYEFEPNEPGNGLGTSFGTAHFDAPVRIETSFPPNVESFPAPVSTQQGFGQTMTSGFTPEVAPSSQPVPAPVIPTTPPVKSRFSDRNVDLPIEVSEEERRHHNDARRFARLLVSEIKLYNEQKVREGREGGDIYDRLRDAIDRSREMYDKRVQPSVSSRFDYFHYEVVNTLAEGDESKLGGAYRR